MFARNVSMRLKPNSVGEFTRTLENEVIPLLRKQKGFQDEISLVIPNGTEAVAISFWDQKENAEAYNRGAYPEVQKVLGKVLDGTPQVQTYEVGNSTFHKIAARAATS
jgi:heme-degrading monooxygenase HmoA